MKPTTRKNIFSFIFIATIVGYFLPSIYENIFATYIPVSMNTVFALILLDFASTKSPPSEKESGVTFKTPTTKHLFLFAKSEDRFAGCRRKP